MPSDSFGPMRVVVIDDDAQLTKVLARILRAANFEVVETTEPLEGLMAAQERDVDVVLSDVQMPNLNGMQLLEELKKKGASVEVVLMTGNGTIEAAVNALRAGAYDYFTKPLDDYDRLIRTLTNAATKRRLSRRGHVLERLLAPAEPFDELVGNSEKMNAVFALVDKVAHSASTVVIQGESGTGKELIARALHRRSPRKDKAFVAVNCSALTETLLESELFGHVKGAFTGAISNKRGLFQAAHGGTLFLDEIGDIPLATQVRLLRVLQEGEVRAVGSNEAAKVDVRVVAATHVNLENATKSGRFREDLYYRLSVITIHLPALRERPEDIPLLASHFSTHYGKKTSKQQLAITKEAMGRLLSHPWMGNVRELENVIERAVVLARGASITENELPPEVGTTPNQATSEPMSWAGLPYYQAREMNESAFVRRYVAGLLEKADGKVAKAAELAGIDRSNLRRIIKQHGVTTPARPQPNGDK